jgi:hypothetical protein
MSSRVRQALACLTVLALAGCAGETIRGDKRAGEEALTRAISCTRDYVQRTAHVRDSADVIADAAYATCSNHWSAYTDAQCIGSDAICPEMRAKLRPRVVETARKHTLAIIVEERALRN